MDREERKMITAPDLSWRYLGPPRTGSTLLTRILQLPPLNGVSSGGQHDCEVLYGAQMIVSVRNPYARFLSLWKHKRYEMGVMYGRRGEDGQFEPISESECPFESFLAEIRGKKEERNPLYGWTMSEWLQDVPVMHRVIRMESFEDDVRSIFPALFRPQAGAGFDTLPTENTSAAVKCALSPYLEPDNVAAVREWAGLDFLRFGYSPAVPPHLLAVRW
jgi:hypothetical protein